MRKIVFLILFLFFLVFSLSASSYSISLTLGLNSTEVEWNEAINASGYAYSNGNPWQGNVSVKLEGSEACSSQTNADGFYNCTFYSPSEIGDFSVKAYALSDSVVVGESDKVLLSVIYFYGSKKPTKNVVAINFPLIIQDLSGRIHRVRAYLKVWG